MLSNKQALVGIGLTIALTILGGFTIMFTTTVFGAGWAVLVALIFVLTSILIFVIGLLYSKGAMKKGEPRKVPVEKSTLQSLLLSAQAPFEIKKGKEYDIVIDWESEQTNKEYIMKIWLDEETFTCNFTEELNKNGKTIKISSKSRELRLPEKKKSLLTPHIWPELKGVKDIHPQEARRLIWRICDKSGWEMKRT